MEKVYIKEFFKEFIIDGFIDAAKNEPLDLLEFVSYHVIWLSFSAIILIKRSLIFEFIRANSEISVALVIIEIVLFLHINFSTHWVCGD